MYERLDLEVLRAAAIDSLQVPYVESVECHVVLSLRYDACHAWSTQLPLFARLNAITSRSNSPGRASTVKEANPDAGRISAKGDGKEMRNPTRESSGYEI